MKRLSLPYAAIIYSLPLHALISAPFVVEKGYQNRTLHRVKSSGGQDNT
jgi:hypothetical protein